MPKQVRVVAALIPDPENPSRFLVQQRLPGKSRPLLWEFPGGKVEAGETDEQALVRECREELAVELKVGALRWETVHGYPDLVVALALYSADLVSGTPQPLSCHALRYATPKEMQALPFCEADLPLLDELVRAGR
ncbi:MAG: (deoxy)nucleoside triphosphate pyrophosphohydrolase [Myxococcaceae bacterium]